MKKSLLALMCFVSMSTVAVQSVATEKQETPAPDKTQVLGQQTRPPATQAGQKATQGQAQTQTGEQASPQPTPEQIKAKQAREAQALFEESLRQMMPLSKGQIQDYREHSDQRERALLPVSPALDARTVRASLEPGQSPTKVYTTANIATSLVFHDSTGQPWPVTSVTYGGPQFFQILRPDLPEGNLLNIMPTQGYATSTIVVTLEGRDVMSNITSSEKRKRLYKFGAASVAIVIALAFIVSLLLAPEKVRRFTSHTSKAGKHESTKTTRA